MTKSSYIGIIVSTLVYWLWESRTAGNIRLDLLLIYPILFLGYTYWLWARFRWWSVIISFLFMGLNFGFFVVSYSWFDKNPGWFSLL